MTEGEEMLNSVVHNLTGRRFRKTRREPAFMLGNSVSNSFYDPRNIGNYENGEIAPTGRLATHYPVNCASNTMGFTLLEDAGDDKRAYYPSLVSGNVNALEKGGAIGTAGSSGSASDYLYFNPFYEALLNPKSHTKMEDIAQPHYMPYDYVKESTKVGAGTNAPSSASAIDYAMNNPYAFPSNFNGGSLGASSSGSASDYYDSNPYRVPNMLNEDPHPIDFMSGGAIDWAKYLGYIRRGAKHIPNLIEDASDIYREVKGVKKGNVIKKAPAIVKKGYKTIQHIKELRKALKGNGMKNKIEEESEEETSEEEN